MKIDIERIREFERKEKGHFPHLHQPHIHHAHIHKPSHFLQNTGHQSTPSSCGSDGSGGALCAAAALVTKGGAAAAAFACTPIGMLAIAGIAATGLFYLGKKNGLFG